MPTSFLPYEPKQDFLLPPSLAEWLPENHLVYFVSEIIDGLNLQIFYARYEGDGRRNQPFDPAMLVKVLSWLQPMQRPTGWPACAYPFLVSHRSTPHFRQGIRVLYACSARCSICSAYAHAVSTMKRASISDHGCVTPRGRPISFRCGVIPNERPT